MSKYLKLQNGSDIRGIAIDFEGEKINLTKDAISQIAYNFKLFLEKKLGKDDLTVAIGRDPRLSGEKLITYLSDTLIELGVTVLDCSLASTPAMFMANIFEGILSDGSIMITASHLPWNRNGFKFFTGDGGLNKSDIKFLLEERDIKFTEKKGVLKSCPELMKYYTHHLRDIIEKELGKDPLKDLKVLVDCGNGSGGFFVRDVLRPLGADTPGSQFLEPNGRFPNHVPNPENKEALESIISAVRDNDVDLGLIFDTDVDRCVAVDESANPIAKNGIVALASTLISDHSGQTVVTDSVANDLLTKFLKEELNVEHYIFKRGYKNVIDKTIELNKEGIDAPLGIETSGHCAFRENFFLDDGAYLALKIVIKVAKLKKEGKKISQLIRSLEHYKFSDEIRISVKNGERVIESISDKLETLDLKIINSFEGIRCEFLDGWCLIRKSLHDPIIVFNIEGNIASKVEDMKRSIMDIIKILDR